MSFQLGALARPGRLDKEYHSHTHTDSLSLSLSRAHACIYLYDNNENNHKTPYLWSDIYSWAWPSLPSPHSDRCPCPMAACRVAIHGLLLFASGLLQMDHLAPGSKHKASSDWTYEIFWEPKTKKSAKKTYLFIKYIYICIQLLLNFSETVLLLIKCFTCFSFFYYFSTHFHKSMS